MEKKVREREDQVARKFKADCADCSEVHGEKLIKCHDSCSYFYFNFCKRKCKKGKEVN